MKKHAEQEEAMKNPPVNAGSGENIATDKAPDQPLPEADSVAEAAKAASSDNTATAAPDKAAELTVRIGELEKINAELQDQYLRKAADFDNYRKRMIKEKQDAIDYANTNLLVDLVQVLDDFDRAIASVSGADAGAPAVAFSDGVTMIRKQLGGLLESKYGLAYYPVKGAHFDPTLHEAIGSVPSPDVKEPTVGEEFTKGYKLKDRIIRVAKVMVQMPVETTNK